MNKDYNKDQPLQILLTIASHHPHTTITRAIANFNLEPVPVTG